MTASAERTTAEIAAFRMRRHGLLDVDPSAEVADLAEAMVGAHAQIPAAAELSFAARSPNLSRDEYRAAIGTGLVRTFGPRGTVHLLPARDLGRWLSALSTAPPALPNMPEGVRLDPRQVAAVVNAVGEALRESDAELTIDELSTEVIRRCGPWAGEEKMPAFGGFWPRWRQALGVAGHAGALCHGVGRGRAVTYTHPSRVVPNLSVTPGPKAVDWLVDSYLRSYGPSTPAHFARWLGVPPAWGQAQFERSEDRLVSVSVSGGHGDIGRGDIGHGYSEGESAKLLAADLADCTGDVAGTVLLLPYFDPFVVGSHPRKWLYQGRAATRALTPAGQAGNYPVVVVDGVVIGVWHLAKRGRRAIVTVELLGRQGTGVRQIIEERAERFARFLDLKIEIVYETVRVGAHA